MADFTDKRPKLRNDASRFQACEIFYLSMPKRSGHQVNADLRCMISVNLFTIIQPSSCRVSADSSLSFKEIGAVQAILGALSKEFLMAILNLRISGRLYAGFGILIASTAVLAAIGYSQLGTIRES